MKICCRSFLPPLAVVRFRAAVMAVIIALVAVMVCGACSTVHAPDDFVVPPDEPKMSAPVVGYRVGFLPLIVLDDFSKYRTDTNTAPARRRFSYPVPVELREPMIQEAVAAMGQIGAFEAVEFLAGEANRDLDAVLRDAWDKGLDIVARPILKRHDCMYVSENGHYVPAMLLWWLTLPISTWWIADETFSSEVTVTIEFYSTATRAAVPFVTRDITGRVQHDLDDFDQGFNVFNIFITPSGLSDGHWEDVGNKLLPLSRREYQRELVATSRDRDAGFAANFAEKADELRKTVAIVCGATAGGGRAPRFADDDIRAISRALTVESPDPLVENRTLLVLDGPRATRAGLLDAIDQLFSRHLRQGDRAMLFLSLRGEISADGTPNVLFADFRSDNRAAASLTLDELAARLATLPTAVVVVASVAWAMADGVDESVMPKNPWWPLEERSNLVVFAATSGAVPLELDQLPGSLFVSELLYALRADNTDTDGDGFLSWAELAAAVKPAIDEIAQLDGEPQSPRLAGPDLAIHAPFFATTSRRSASASTAARPANANANTVAGRGNEN